MTTGSEPSRTPSSYDEIPYGNLAFPQAHPDRLATVGRIFGLPTAGVDRCRVLELGCASGGHLLPIAFSCPDSTFVGVDLSQVQVDAAHATIAALGLRNVDIRCASILDVDDSWGTFDYIICHGVFSWVERPVQDKILAIARRQLAPNGVAYISYNTYPGWHLRESVRHMMRYHANRFDDAPEQIDQARALLNFLASAADDKGAYGQLLGREIERLKGASDSYLFHEHLEPTNAPLYFHQFMERAEAAGLQYLAEADVSDMLSSTFSTDVARTLEEISPNLLHLEQYMDFVRNRLFRQTLLCHQEQRPARALNPARLEGLLLSSRLTTERTPIDLTPMTPVVFTKGEQHASVARPASKAAFSVLMEQWPGAVPVSDLLTAALDRATSHLAPGAAFEARTATMSELLHGVLHGFIRVHTCQPPCAHTLDERPRAHPVAAYQVATSPIVVNAHHEMIRLESLGIEVLKLADGTRTAHEIFDVLIARVESGAMTVSTPGGVGLEGESMRDLLENEVERTLQGLLRNALLAAR